MAVSLETLVERLKGEVTARSGVPSEEQYEQAIKSAVTDFSGRAPMKKYGELSIANGTASYALPADFRRVISLESPFSPDGVLNTPNGLIPISPGFRERYTIAGGRITFIPTPEYSLTRGLWYAAGYVLDSESVYQDMTETEADIIILKAQAMAVQLLANKAAGEGWRYKIGDEEVDKSKIGAGLGDRAKSLNEDYLAAVKTYNGEVGMRSYDRAY